MKCSFSMTSGLSMKNNNHPPWLADSPSKVRSHREVSPPLSLHWYFRFMVTLIQTLITQHQTGMIVNYENDENKVANKKTKKKWRPI